MGKQKGRPERAALRSSAENRARDQVRAAAAGNGRAGAKGTIAVMIFVG
jgi:hypothetical protein